MYFIEIFMRYEYIFEFVSFYQIDPGNVTMPGSLSFTFISMLPLMMNRFPEDQRDGGWS